MRLFWQFWPLNCNSIQIFIEKVTFCRAVYSQKWINWQGLNFTFSICCGDYLSIITKRARPNFVQKMSFDNSVRAILLRWCEEEHDLIERLIWKEVFDWLISKAVKQKCEIVFNEHWTHCFSTCERNWNQNDREIYIVIETLRNEIYWRPSPPDLCQSLHILCWQHLKPFRCASISCF